MRGFEAKQNQASGINSTMPVSPFYETDLDGNPVIGSGDRKAASDR